MTIERWQELKKEASVLKLTALRKSALGGDGFGVLVTLHRAAAAELDAAAEAVNESSARDAQIEACGLLLEARDWPAANKVWSKLTADAQDDLPEALRELYVGESVRFAAAWAAFAATLPDPHSFRSVHLAPVERVLKAFPGVAGFWWAKYRFYERERQWLPAREALDHAIELTPENPRFIAMRMLLSVAIDRPASAQAGARRVWQQRRESSAEVNQIFALVLLKTTRARGREHVLDELDEATERAERMARGAALERQAALLRAYVKTLLGEPRVELLADYMERGAIDERRVLESSLPDWDDQVLQMVA